MLFLSSACQCYVAEKWLLRSLPDRLFSDRLLVLDQGYPARWLIAYLVQQGIQFCMRVDETGFAAVKNFLRSEIGRAHV